MTLEQHGRRRPACRAPRRTQFRKALGGAASAAVVAGVTLTTLSAPTSAAGVNLSWLGAYTFSGGTTEAANFGREEGAPVSWSTAFLSGGQGWSAIDNPSWYIAQWPATSGLHMDWSIPILNSPGDTLSAGAAGAYDLHYLNLARAFVSAGQPSVTFRLGWEMDGTYQPWYAGNDPSDFASYWRQIVTTMRSVPGQHFTFDWNAGGSAPGDPVYQSYPGDQYVDYITNDVYDASWDAAAGYAGNHATAAGYQVAWQDTLTTLRQLQAFGALHNKPIGLPEWGLWYRSDGHGGGDDPYFVSQMYQWLTTTPNLAFANYYDSDNDGLHALYDGNFPTSAAVWTSLITGAASTSRTTTTPTTSTTVPTTGTTVPTTSTTAPSTSTTTSPTTTSPTTVPNANPLGQGTPGSGQCPGPSDVPTSGIPVQMTAVNRDGCAGYWVATSTGRVSAFGAAPDLGQMQVPLNQPVVTIAATPDGRGFWMAAADGGIFTFGDAHFYGSTGNIRLNQPIVGMAPTPDGRGYWLAAADGGIFTFGDARFYGSTGNIRLNQPIVGMAPNPGGSGYYLVARDGGIFTFGSAPFRGSLGAVRLNRPIVGMSLDVSSGGYYLVASDGGVFTFNAPFFGSLAGQVSSPVLSVTPTPDDAGYYALDQTGAVYTMGDAKYLGEL